jgi:hypothetical protein
VRPLGGFVHSDVNPELVQASVGPPVLAGPLTCAVPEHRIFPLSLGADRVKVPEKLVLVTAPLMVPFQSKDADVQVPVTLESV